jgi:glycerophosphoryl diester phosphodiesterase
MSVGDWLTARPIAHRAYHDRANGRIENTISAVIAAIGHNFSIEVDLQLTADGEVIVFHDDTLERLTESTGRVDLHDLPSIRAVRLRDTSDRIPTLDEILEEVSGKVLLILELKSRWDGDRRLEQAVTTVLANYAGPIAVMSFDPGAMRAMRKLMPHLPRGLVAERFRQEDWQEVPFLYRFALRHLLAAAAVIPDFIAYNVSALPATAPLSIRHALGLPLLTWTVRTQGEQDIARSWADQMIFEGFDPDQRQSTA